MPSLALDLPCSMRVVIGNKVAKPKDTFSLVVIYSTQGGPRTFANEQQHTSEMLCFTSYFSSDFIRVFIFLVPPRCKTLILPLRRPWILIRATAQLAPHRLTGS
jgi:hypothetical protein